MRPDVEDEKKSIDRPAKHEEGEGTFISGTFVVDVTCGRTFIQDPQICCL
jgi:hypothetical protein